MWHLTNIPKIIHFYWGGTKLSYLRFLSILSFKVLNPEWQIYLHVCKENKYYEVTWGTPEQLYIYDEALDFLPNAKSIVDTVVEHDFYPTVVHKSHHAIKSDFLRWQLLSTIGGVWSDMDILYDHSIDNLIENTISNSKATTILCNNPDSKCFPIGFLMASANNHFFKEAFTEASRDWASDYQAKGAILIAELYKRHTPASFLLISEICVYSIKYSTPTIYYDNSSPRVPEKIGYHWYAGHPNSNLLEQTIVEGNQTNKEFLSSIALKIEGLNQDGTS